MLAVVLAFSSSLCWGLADFLGGLQSRTRPLVTVLLVAQVAAVAMGVAFVAASGDPFPDLGPAALATGAGVAGCAALAAFYRGLAIGTMSIVAPVSATGAAVPVLVGLAEGERPAALQIAGIVVAMAGIVLAAREPGGRPAEPRPARLAGARRARGAGLRVVLRADRPRDGAGRRAVVAAARARRRGRPAGLARARDAAADAHAGCATPRRCCSSAGSTSPRRRSSPSRRSRGC